MLSLPWAQVQSLVRELRSHMPYSVIKKKKKKKKPHSETDTTSKVTVFPVVIYGCKSWTIKKAER